MVWTLQATGTNLGQTWREIQGSRVHRHRQDGLHRQRVGGGQGPGLPHHQTLQEGHKRDCRLQRRQNAGGIQQVLGRSTKGPTQG